MNTELQRALERVAHRVRKVRLRTGLALCWAAWAAVGLALIGLGVRPSPAWMIALASGAVASGVACGVLAWRSVRDARWMARRIEARHPDLDAGLLAAVEELLTPSPERAGFLRDAVIRKALGHSRSHDWGAAVPSWKLGGSSLALVVALLALLAVGANLVDRTRARTRDLAARPPAPSHIEIQVEPGNASVERGSSLLVVARFPGFVPPDANLVVDSKDDSGASRAMTRSLDDPTFAGRLESVDADLAYKVEFAGRSSDTFRVRVFEYPALLRTDARLSFPSYTGLETRVAEDIRHVSAIEGTELTLHCRLNKDVASAKLVDEKGGEIPLAPPQDDSRTYTATFTLADSHKYKVQLVDREGLRNKIVSEIAVNVSRNKPPTIVVRRPGHDTRVSPVEEMPVRAEVADDFGVVRHGVNFSIAGAEPKDVVLGDGKAPASKKVEAEHLLDFEAMKAEPDQLLTYHVWAEDIGPDGKPRRTDGDMFFAEVRHFEEIFRQGEPPSGDQDQQDQEQQGGNAQQAEKLAELQKQIINGTWKVVRREIKPEPTDAFEADAVLLRDSQRQAIDQAKEMGEKLRDAGSKASLDQAIKAMTLAAYNLDKSSKEATLAGLPPALSAEQAAYQALLKLRAREFEVTRRNSRQRQQGGGSASASQRQLDQLELKDDENRFEQQSKAKQDEASQKEQEQRETRQVVNRLRELARRQADLNERVKELQAALEAAKDDPAKEEIERQLKRLREQQQQILRDTDELQERMESEQNRDRMAEARQQVEQGRENIRQASEALEQGKLSQALNEGTRANQKFDDVREDLRKKSSDQFSEQMTAMRDQARKLDEDQDKLTEKLDAWKDKAQQTLRDTEDRQKLKQELDGQRKGFEDLVDRMQKTVQEAEETEPILAKNLFDAARKADVPKTTNELKDAEQLVDAGIADEAAESSRRAGQGIDQAREGIERAARGILGDEAAALRRARAEVDDLADQINREIAQATGNPAPGRPGSNPRQPTPGQAPQPGQPGDPQPGQDPQAQDGQQPGQEGEQPGQPGQRPGQGQQRPGQQGQRQPEQQARGQQPGQQGQPGENQDGQQGQQPGEGQDGQQPGEGQQPGQQGQGQQGQGRQPGQQGQQGQGQQPGQGEQSGQQGQAQPGQEQQQGQGQQPGQQGGQGGGGGQRQAGQPQGGRPGSGLQQMLDGLANNGPTGPGGPGNPITGEGFRQWSDRMREVEELLDDPNLRAEAARIRDRVRGAREDFKRHAKEPDWKEMQGMVADPILELARRIGEEVRRRESPDALVPIDRDPVPPRYAEGVRRYYERLGSGR